ncbi:MAG: ATP-binding protein [Planctomycetota bacterium]
MGTHVELSVPNDRSAITRLGEQFVREAGEAGYSEASCFAVRLALEEAVVNAFRHGHKDVADDVPVELVYDIHADRIEISIEDAGPGFDPAKVPDPTAPENITKTSGRGLLLIRSYMTEVRHTSAGNRIEMRYDKPEG